MLCAHVRLFSPYDQAMRAATVPFSATVAVAVIVAALFLDASAAAIDPTIMWKDCTGPADHPTVGKGNYFNLCIEGHEFKDERFAYTFTKTQITKSSFDGCTFANTPSKKMSLEGATWKDVRFTDTTFASFTSDPVVFEKTLLENVIFDSCTFDATTKIVFTEFEFRNVTFLDCQFQSDTMFQLGRMTDTFFNNTNFKRSPEAKTVSGSDRVTFDGVTVRKAYFTDNDFITPLAFQAAEMADVHFNDTKIGQFWCHDVPKGNDEPEKFASFNDTIFDNVAIRGDVHCDRTTWRGMHMEKVRFQSDVSFALANILDIYWSTVSIKSTDSSCTTLDMSQARIHRKVFADVTADCKALFADTTFDQVFIKNFNARQPSFKDAIFSDQEFIDGQCCTNACVNLDCKCNVTDPSGNCPVGSSKVNLNAGGSCFAAHSTVSLLEDSSVRTVRMDALAHSDHIAVGGGEHSDIFMFGHRDPSAMTHFVRIDTAASGAPLLITPGHYLYVNGRLATAESVRVGDRLRGADNVDSVAVHAVAREQHRGAYAPTTVHGDLVVEGVVVSSYTDVIHPRTAHRLLAPLRALHNGPLRGLVAHATSIMDTQSFDWLARRLQVAAGPETVDRL